MKVIVNEKPIIIDRNYPYIGQSSNTGCIVLFYKEKTGVCLFRGKSGRDVGDHDYCWGEELFAPFTGEIVLSNG